MSKTVFDHFVDGFGGGEASIRAEMRQHWQKHGHFPLPTELYDTLANARTNTRDANRYIRPSVAEALKHNFHDSFTPEHTTGYYAKHRIPVMDALTKIYLEDFPERPLYRVSGDIGNLGGINEATLSAARTLYREAQKLPANKAKKDLWEQLAHASGEIEPEEQIERIGRLQADRIIGVIAGIVRDGLESQGHITALRQGGDEIAFVIEPRQNPSLSVTDVIQAGEPGTDPDEHRIRQAFAEIEQLVREFAQEAGLTEIAHLKYPELSLDQNAQKDPGEVAYQQNALRRGLTIGLGVFNPRTKDDYIIDPGIVQDALELDILVSKINQTQLRKDCIEQGQLELPLKPVMPKMAALQAALDARQKYWHHPKEVLTTLPGLGETPEIDRLEVLRANAMKAVRGELLPQEEALVRATHALTQRYDPVNGLPLFGHMSQTLLPHFRQHMIGAPKLAHIDFSGLGAGNELSAHVGDAMFCKFAQAIQNAFDAIGYPELKNYLAVQKDGPRFALLLPASFSNEQFSQLTRAIEEQIIIASEKPLVLQIHSLLRDEIYERHRADLESRGRDNADFDGIRMEDLRSRKKHAVEGVIVTAVMAEDPLAPDANLGKAMRPLEQRKKILYKETVKRLTEARDVDGTETEQPGNTDQSNPGGRKEASDRAAEAAGENAGRRASQEKPVLGPHSAVFAVKDQSQNAR